MSIYTKWIRELESYGCIVRRGFLDFETNRRYATGVINCQCGGSRYFSAAKNPLSLAIQPFRFYRYVRRMRKHFNEG